MDGIQDILGKIKARQDAFRGNSSLSECPNCEDRGYTIRRREDGSLDYRECACSIRKRSMERIERSGLKSLLERCTMESYQTPEAWQKQAKESALRYLEDWRGKWFYFGGSPGSGKTHLCTAMCGKLLDAGLPVRYVQWRSDIPAIKAKANDAEAYKAALDPLKSVRVLYIDDFLKGAATEADRNIAFDLLNARYIKPDCVTILSSERSIGDVIDWDEAVGSRIAERAAGNIIAVSGRKNWRMK